MDNAVCVVITAWNQAAKTVACLESVFNQTYANRHVVLVNNGSRPGFEQIIRDPFPQVHIISNQQNLGFAGGYNVGLRYGMEQGFPCFLLLNNDTLLAPDCLERLVAATTRQPDIGLVTAKVYYSGEPERVWTVGNQIHPLLLEARAGGEGELDEGQWSEDREIAFAPLASVLISRKLLEDVGFLDEEFFLYYEDMDFCRRVKTSGFQLYLAAEAHVWHDVAASSGGSDSPSERYWMAQSSGRFFRKHGGWRLPLIVPYRVGSAVKMVAKLLWQRRWRAAAAYLLGLSIGWTTGRAVTAPPRWVSHER
ncbi:MAG: glycosyltransferase family 2 protein [Candidatus Promineifilaceae bacterium]|nr:glycosyltransferase family 2 protein [Candidatus Promineifilaceae bacterium]